MAGITRASEPGQIGYTPVAPTPVYGDPGTYGTAAKRQLSDYDTIMSKYASLTTPSADVTGSVANLGELAKTGGYSDQAISDIRARGISPIRSIYAQANENLNRQRSLQGGYEPNLAAATAKMAREEAGAISGRTTDVNAQIAQSIAQNRLAASSPYASAAAGETGLQLEAAGGMRGLYGTTPALTSIFGQQVGEAARLGQGQQDINIRRQQTGINSPIWK